MGLGRSGSDSLLGMGLGDSGVFGGNSMVLSTPTPGGTVGKAGAPSVGLNSKWLYDKGRSSLGRSGIY